MTNPGAGMMTSLDVSDLIGVKHSRGGREVTEGLDCYGLVRVVCRRLGVDLPMNYGDLANRVDSIAREIRTGELLRVGDIQVMTPMRDGESQHLAIVISPYAVVHSVEKIGVKIDRIGYMRRRGKWLRLLPLDTRAKVAEGGR